MRRILQLTARLRKKFSIKNTTGYHMEAFLDGSTPLEIFRRLIVGSEGTLAFIAEAVFETVPDDQYRLTSFMIFPDMHAACAAVKPFVDHGAAAVELVDRASLRSVEGKPGVPERWKTLPENATGLLVEFRAPSEAARAEAERTANATLAGMSLLEPAAFTTRSGARGAILERAQRPAPLGRRRATSGLVIHSGGRVLPAGAPRRRRARSSGPVRQAWL